MLFKIKIHCQLASQKQGVAGELILLKSTPVDLSNISFNCVHKIKTILDKSWANTNKSISSKNAGLVIFTVLLLCYFTMVIVSCDLIFLSNGSFFSD